MADYSFVCEGGDRMVSRAAHAVIVCLAVCSFVFAQKESGATPAAAQNPKLTIPADTAIPLQLKNTISSKTAYVGQAIYCETIYPITVGNRIVIPVGSYVKGAVTQVVRPGRVKGRAQMGLRFESLTLPSGVTVPLRATLSGFAGNGEEGFRREESKVEGASSKKDDAATIARTGMDGAIIGGIAGRSPKGAGLGAAGGGLAGLIWVLATRGKEIMLPPGTSLELQLSTPLTFTRDQIEGDLIESDGPAIPRRDPGPGA